jgi:hypothetical protein
VASSALFMSYSSPFVQNASRGFCCADRTVDERQQNGIGRFRALWSRGDPMVADAKSLARQTSQGQIWPTA